MPTIPSALPKDLFLLNPDIAFLNHGSFGATPKPVLEKYQWWQRELEWQPVEFLGTQRRYGGLMREARGALASFIHTDADNLVYVRNATTAMNIVARSLQFQPGDEILTPGNSQGGDVVLNTKGNLLPDAIRRKNLRLPLKRKSNARTVPQRQPIGPGYLDQRSGNPCLMLIKRH